MNKDSLEELLFSLAQNVANDAIGSVNKILKRSQEDGYEIEEFEVTVLPDDGLTVKVGANAKKRTKNGSKF